MKNLGLRSLPALLVASALVSASAAMAVSEGMGGANVGIVGGFSTFGQQGENMAKDHDSYSTLFGGNLGISGGYNWDMGRFILGADVTFGWEMVSGESNKSDAAKKFKTELGFGTSVGVLLGADLKFGMPFVRLGYAYQGITISGKDASATTKDKKFEEGLHAFQWGIGMDTRMGPLVVGLEYVQNVLGEQKAKDTGINEFPVQKDEKVKTNYSQVRLRVLYHL